MNKCLIPLSLVVFGLVGCQPPATNTPNPETNKPATAAATEAPASTPKVEDIAADLKTDGYTYYGLDCKKTLTYKLTQQPNLGEKTGTQSVVYKGLHDGNPTFTIKRDGDLSILGDDEVILKPDGVYSTFAAATTIDPPMLALPAKLAVDVSWPSHETVKGMDGKDIKIDMTNKVVRKEKIKVAGGEFDCFVATTTGNLTKDQKIGVNGTSWYAPGYGVVKMVLNIKDKDGDRTSTIELTSQG